MKDPVEVLIARLNNVRISRRKSAYKIANIKKKVASGRSVYTNINDFKKHVVRCDEIINELKVRIDKLKLYTHG